MTVTDAIGLFGVFLYVCSYAGLQLGILGVADLRYNALNAVGGIAVIYSLIWNFNLAALVMQVLWFVFTVVGFIRSQRKNRATVSAVDGTNSKCPTTADPGP